jgi:serine O-acetyltransferase
VWCEAVTLTSSGHSLRQLVRSDVEQWLRIWRPDLRPAHGAATRTGLRFVWTHAGLQATLLFRASQVLHRRGVPVLPQLLWRLNIMLFGLDIPPAVDIGPGLYIPHPVGTVVMARGIGARVTLVSGITVGMRRGGDFPTLGDDVYVGAGARILGSITVGSGARIGANAVVLRDVPDGAAAVGIPATVRPPSEAA